MLQCILLEALSLRGLSSQCFSGCDWQEVREYSNLAEVRSLFNIHVEVVEVHEVHAMQYDQQFLSST